MGSTTDLASKWTTIHEDGGTVEAYDLSQATAHSFFLVFNDRGGDGPCAVDITAVGAFEDAEDCLGYLRYQELPEMLDWRSTFEQRAAERHTGASGQPDLELESDLTELADALEQAMGGRPSADDLGRIRHAWNDAFALTNPGSTIETWGTLAELIASPYVREILLDEDHEGEFDDLVASVDGGRFDAEDPADLADALTALSTVERF